MIEAILDFHKLGKITTDQAKLTLDLFLEESYIEKYRQVLVITGKGNNAQQPGKSVLRDTIKSQLKIHKLVRSFKNADLWDGGEGAFEVSLKA